MAASDGMTLIHSTSWVRKFDELAARPHQRASA
jgi:hypothetical protein